MNKERRTYARRKQRSFQQLMEEASGQVLRASLPEQWVIHEYSPDYGIDGTVEMFEYTDGGKEYAEALGETVFFQLKSVRDCEMRSVTLEPRMNVEKMELQRGVGEPADADVVPVQLEPMNFSQSKRWVQVLSCCCFSCASIPGLSTSSASRTTSTRS
jgi:hypothetical protein